MARAGATWLIVLAAVAVGPTPAARAAASPPASAPADDVVEVIEPLPDAPASAPAPSAPLTAPALGQALTLTGWLRTSVEGGLERAGYHYDAPNPADVPYDQVVGRAEAHLRLRLARGRRFEAVLSGLLSFAVFEQDADQGATFWGFNGASSRTTFEATLREAYVGWFWRRLDLRLGQQRVAWGRGDAFAPNDVLNARDIRDPILAEPEALNLPTLMLRATVDTGPVLLEAAVVPFFTPDRFGAYGRNWSLVQPDAPQAYRQLLFAASRLVHPTLEPALEPLLGQTSLPHDNLSGTQVGLRVARTFRRLDLDLYYHFGYDRRAQLRVDPAFMQTLAGLDLSTGRLANLTPIIEALDAGQHPFAATYQRRHHVGGSAQVTLGLWTLRADLAFDSRLVAIRRADLTGAVTPALQAVVGTEYQSGEHGNSIIVEAWYQHLVDAPADGTLLGFNRDTAAFAAHWRWTFFDRLEVELRGVLGVKPFSFSVRPQVGWKWRALAVRVGVLALDGADGSLPHYYRRNRVAYALVRYAF